MNLHGESIQSGVRFSKRVFLLAGVIGLVETIPLYFAEATVGRTQPPAVTHPEFYYGFIGVVAAWQVAFLIISSDPPRYRPLLPALFMEKALYPAAVYALFALGRVTASTVAVASLDLVWLALFIAAWVKLRSSGAPGPHEAIGKGGAARWLTIE